MRDEIIRMVATPGTTLPKGPDCLFEVKWDGVRAVAFTRRDAVRLTSRKGTSIERQYPELAGMQKHVAAQTAILDGEIVALDSQGHPSFALLQPRIGSVASAVTQLARSRPVNYFVFDLLYFNGYDLRNSPPP